MEKPILFNTEMVQAILEGRKTQTRRVIKPQPPAWCEQFGYTMFTPNGCISARGNSEKGLSESFIKLPYQKGDILYVRETWTTIDNFKNYADAEIDKNLKYLYKCDDNGKEHVFIDVGVKKWKPSIHMPKEAARIFLKVTDVRVERLQDITEEGAIAEGIRAFTKDGQVYKYSCTDEFNWREAPRTAKEAFEKLWNSCYKWPKSWDYDPWVWAIEFQIKAKKEGFSMDTCQKCKNFKLGKCILGVKNIYSINEIACGLFKQKE